MSLFLMLYGREALLPKEIEHTTYNTDSEYEKAVAGNISKIISIQELASSRNSQAAQQSGIFWPKVHEEVYSLHVCGRGCSNINNKNCLKDIKNVRVLWIGTCTVVYEQQGKLKTSNINVTVGSQITMGTSRFSEAVPETGDVRYIQLNI